MSCVGIGGSQAQLSAKRKKKFTGGNASKRHRDRVNVEFNNLAKLLPYPEAMISKLDKSSILRLAVSYIRAKSFFKDNVSTTAPDEPISKRRKHDDDALPSGPPAHIADDTGNSMAEIFLQALEGFLLVITEDLKVLYVSESVRDYLGYCQAGIIHESILNFVHASDEGIIRHALQLLETRRSNDMPANGNCDKQTDADCDVIPSSASDSSSLSSLEDADPRDLPLVQSRKFVCRMKCAFSCSSRFFTAFNSFQFSGHLRKSFVQEGKVKKSLNTLIVFCSPMGTNGKYDNIDVIDHGLMTTDDKSTHAQWPNSDDDMMHDGVKPKLTGLPIEPKFRLHVAPIVMSSRDLEHCSVPKSRHSMMKARRSAAAVSHACVRDDYGSSDTEQQQQSQPPLPQQQQRGHHRRGVHQAKQWYRRSEEAGSPLVGADDAMCCYPYHRMTRARSSECLHPLPAAAASCINGEQSPSKGTFNGAREFPPEVFSSAKILLDLSQHYTARKEYNSAGSGTAQRTVVKTEPPEEQQRCADDAYLETHRRIYHIPHERAQQQQQQRFPYANGIMPTASSGYCGGACELEHAPRHSEAGSPKTAGHPAKRGFNITSLLGLDEKRMRSRDHVVPRELRCANGNILHFPKKREAATECQSNDDERGSSHGNHDDRAAATRRGDDEGSGGGTMEDMKSSFANILQGMASNIADRFNTAITQAIEKTNDRRSTSPPSTQRSPAPQGRDSVSPPHRGGSPPPRQQQNDER